MHLIASPLLLLTLAAPDAAQAVDDQALAREFAAQRAAGHYREAVEAGKRIVARAEALQPSRPLAIAQALTELAACHDEYERFAEAEPLFKRALAIREKELPSDHADVAQSLHNLAHVEDRLGRYREAESLGGRALAIREKTLPADDLRVAKSLDLLAYVNEHQGHYDDAEKLEKKALAIFERVRSPEHLDVARGWNQLGRVYDHQGRYVEADTAYQRALAICEKRPDRFELDVAWILCDLAELYAHLARYAEAEPLYRRSLALYEKHHGPEHNAVAVVLNHLGILYDAQGRYVEAESLYKRALAIWQKVLPADHPDTVTATHNLAALYLKQHRYAEAEPLYLQALRLWEKALPPDHPVTAACVSNLAVLYKRQGRFTEAEAFCKRALASKEKSLGPQHPDTAKSVNNLAVLYHKQGRDAAAETLFTRSLAIREQVLGPEHPEVAAGQHSLADLYHDLGRDAEAQPLIDRAIQLRDRTQVSPGERSESYELRAKIAWNLGQRDEAITDLRQAMELAEQQRGQSSGAEQERAASFSRFSSAFERMVAWQVELGDVGEALAAIERSRARSLLDEMNLGGADLQIGRSPAEREQLRQQEIRLQEEVAVLERKLAAARSARAGDKNAEERGKLEAELSAARTRLYDHYREQRGTSPVYRNLLSVGSGPPRVSQLRRRLIGDDGLLLAYLLGEAGGYVAVVGPDRARLETLNVSEKQAGALGVAAGPLTAECLWEAFSGKDRPGILARLATRSSSPELTAALTTLWELLVPEPERAALMRGAVARLIVVPDGPLAMLPLETLVVEPGNSPRYLIDVETSVCYAPSATILYNLVERRAATAAEEPRRPLVLTVADPAYPPPESSDGGPATALEELTARSRYCSVGGALGELPYAALESARVAEVFQRQGIGVAELRRQSATEANVRAEAPHRRVLHLACHGLAEQTFGNFFGALALTPGAAAASDPADDGFLTLPEIYALNLKDCELAILSACQTNFGPQQRGEGVWALSRGFLVAGARRVVASDWLVDDEAAANLVSMYCNRLAQAEGEGRPPDYAAALHAAKRWVRAEEKWKSPYYWGPFVLVGPH